MWRPFVALLLRTSIAISKETIQYCCYIENLKRCIFLSLRRTLHKMLLFFNIDFSISILITLFTTEEEEIDKLDSPSNILKCNHPSSFQTSTQSFKDSSTVGKKNVSLHQQKIAVYPKSYLYLISYDFHYLSQFLKMYLSRPDRV